MKIIEATWEKRNLGLTTYEITIENTDTPDQFREALKEVKSRGAQYIVVKTPVNLPDFLWTMSEDQFIFAEAQMQIYLKKDGYRPPQYLQTFDRHASYRLIQKEEEANQILTHYKNGVFETDRIYIDNYFEKNISGMRYFNWALDMYKKKEAYLYEFLLKDKPAGSFIMRPGKNNTMVSILTTVNSDFVNKGIGLILFKKNADAAFDSQYDAVEAAISSNNLQVLSVWMELGSIIKNIQYVYIKHIQ